eukprot:CAMPEP_0172929864 /NCGR_PEP_ID=MMETSP1075-20121228/218702_1 /TAXON_ID=2916 /ORGANISM="Ceratium fusus, Strain PA161109" /LENGTH=224 /DNA_ID=CAMNT_0013791169 /DNA_START=78 /DNA_END=752 /DNA_ORIENTATION=-
MGSCVSPQARKTNELDAGSGFASLPSSGDMLRTVAEASTPVRFSTRQLQVDQFLHQRMQASTHFGSDAHSQQRSAPVAHGVFHGRNRMSHMSAADMAEMVGEIQKSANSSCKDLHDLRERLDKFGLCMKEMKGDGNCQFRSLAFNLLGHQDHHAMTRKAAVAHMRKHADFFGCMFEDSAEFNAYLRDMARARTWGDELTLRAIVEAYNCEAHLITSEPSNWYLV